MNDCSESTPCIFHQSIAIIVIVMENGLIRIIFAAIYFTPVFDLNRLNADERPEYMEMLFEKAHSMLGSRIDLFFRFIVRHQ